MHLDPDTCAAVQSLVESRRRAGNWPSIACAIVQGGEVHGLFASGAIEGQTPTADTVYRIASMTKSFTAAALLLLRDDGVLALDDPMARYLPEFAHLCGPTSDAPELRLRDLLSMASGLVTDDPWADRHMDCTDDEIDRWFAPGAMFAWPTATAYEYSNLGYALLGRVVQRASGQRLQDVVTTRLLEPLALTRTSWIPPAAAWARPHRIQDHVAIDEGSPPVGDGALAPLGGLWSSLADIARWVAFFADAFPARDGPDDAPLRRASRREMQQIQRYVGSADSAERKVVTGYGYGLNVRDDPLLGTVVSHSGGLPGYGSNMRWLLGEPPLHGLGVIAFANVTYAPMARLTLDVLELLQARGALDERRVAEPTPLLRSMAVRLVALLANWNDDDANALFSDNVALDEPLPRRRTAALALLARCGTPLRIGALSAQGAASATIHLEGAHATIDIDFELAPLLPARIQDYRWSSGEG